MRTLALFFFLTFFPAIAFAHANFYSSSPAPYSSVNASPPNITIKFTEILEPAFSSITLLDVSGNPVNTNNATVDPSDKTVMVLQLPKLQDGPYIVYWRSMSAIDGHVVQSSYVIRIGNSSQSLQPPKVQATEHPPDPVEVALRWLTFLFETALIGVCSFVLFVWSPPSVSALGGKFEEFDSTLINTFRSVRRYSIVVLLAVAFLYEIYQAASNGPLSALTKNLQIIASETFFGHVLDVRIVLLGVILGLDMFVSALKLSAKSEWAFFLAAGLCILFTTSLTSHTAAGDPFVGLFSDWIHQLSGMIWLGSIFLLTLVSYEARRVLQGEDKRLSATIVPRFSKLTLIGLIIVSLSGIYLTVVDVKTFANLFGTSYGQVLLVKIAVVALIVVLGFLKRQSVYRVAARWLSGLVDSLVRTQDFLKPIASELGLVALLAAVLLLSVSVLTAGSPPLNQPGPMVFSGLTTDSVVNLTITPFKPGTNDFIVSVYDVNGRPLEDINDVRLYFDYEDKDIGKLSKDFGTPINGTIYYSGDFLALPGNWTITVDVSRNNSYDTITRFHFDLPDQNLSTPNP